MYMPTDTFGNAAGWVPKFTTLKEAEAEKRRLEARLLKRLRLGTFKQRVQAAEKSHRWVKVTVGAGWPPT